MKGSSEINLKVEVIRTAGDLHGIRGEWSSLLEQSEAGTPYQTWEWNHTWAAHLPFNQSALVLTLRTDDGVLVGIAPLCIKVEWGMLRTVSFLSQDHSIYPDFITAPGYERSCIESALAFLAANDEVSALNLIVSAPSPTVERMGPLLVEGPWLHVTADAYTKRLMVPLDNGYEEYLASLSRKMRQEIKAECRKLEKLHSVRFEVFESPPELADAFNTLLSLNALKWGGEPSRKHLERRLCYQAFNGSGIPKLFVLFCDGKPAGALSALVMDETVYTEIAGFDFEIARIDLGKVFYSMLFQWAGENGCRRVDFSSGVESYKLRYNPVIYDKYRFSAYKSNYALRVKKVHEFVAWTLDRTKRNLLQTKLFGIGDVIKRIKTSR